jgi:hypothetical protein
LVISCGEGVGTLEADDFPQWADRCPTHRQGLEKIPALEVASVVNEMSAFEKRPVAIE